MKGKGEAPQQQKKTLAALTIGQSLTMWQERGDIEDTNSELIWVQPLGIEEKV